MEGWEGDTTKNYERCHLSTCCNPYTGSRSVNMGSEGKAQENMRRKSVIKRTEKEIIASALCLSKRPEMVP